MRDDGREGAMPIKVREMIRKVEQDGWYYRGSTGGHRHYKHPTKPGKVTISGKMNQDIPPEPPTISFVRRD
jgi:predicted RNA binding protein YcfA (HicA-like mRNA interferase family)